MKVKVCRASGNPVKYEHIEQFQQEHRNIYDKVMKKFKLTETSKIDEKLSERLTKLFDRINISLLKKYPLEEEWDMVTEQEAWHELIKQYGNIMISRDKEKNQLIYVIFDIEV